MKLNFTVSIEPLGKGHYSVPIRSGNKPYTVDLRIFHDTPGYESYSCPDFRRRHDTCLHRFAATIYRAKAPTRARGSGRGSRRPGRPQADGRIIYLLHFDRRYRHAGHYLGFCEEGELPRRLACHRKGDGTRLMEVITQAGIGFELARTWPGGRLEERQIKG
jgi:hypothetical protein